MKWKSIRARLFFTFMALAGVPLVLVGGTLAWRTVVVQKRQSVALEREVASYVAERIKSFLLDLEEKLTLADRLEGLTEASQEKRKAVLQTLLDSKDKPFRSLVLLDRRGMELASVPAVPPGAPLLTTDWSGRNEFLLPQISGRTYFGPVRFDARTREPGIYLAVPLKDPLTGAVTGALVADCVLDSVWDFITTLRTQEGESVYVVDGEGRVAAHPNDAYLKAQMRFSVPEQDGFAMGLSGAPVILASRRLDLDGRILDVVAEKDVGEALVLAKETIFIIIALFALALLVGAGLAYLLVRHVVKPIRELAVTARAVKNGDYSRRAEAATDDEIGELAHAFNSMTAKLTETMEGLEEKVAELTATQEKLRDSEEKYRLLAENSADVIWTVDQNLRLAYCSPSIERLTGFRPDELRERPFGALLTPQSQQIFQEAHARRIREESAGALSMRARSQELEHVRKDGGLVWVECVISPLRNEQGKLKGYMGVSRDIAKRRQAEEALRLSEERFRAIADYTYDWESWFGADGRLMWVNPAVKRVTGYAQEECMSMPDYPLPMVHSEDREIVASYLRYAMEGGTGNDREFALVRRGGDIIHVAMSWQPIFDSSGAFQGVRASIRDVTERKRAEKALRESETKFRMLHEQASEGIVLMDADARILDANPRALELLEYGAEDIRKIRYQDLIHPEEIEVAPIRLPSVLAGETVRIERQLRKKSGDYIPFDVSARLIGDNVVQLMLRDMTERKRIEEELRHSRDIAEEANRAKGDFVARVSHEIRNPLSGILGMTDLVMKTSLADDQREYLGMIRDAAGSLLTIINDLLDFSKIEAGKLDLRPVDFDIHETLSRIMKGFSVRAESKGIELKMRIAANVPALINGDPLRLTQVVRNFLDNAMKFTDAGGVSLDVKRIERPGEAVKLLFQIRDTGSGIAGEDLPKLFQSFSQVGHSYKKRRQGTGLGLSISKQLVEMMNGTVWVESKVGKGTTFYFTAGFRPSDRTALPVSGEKSEEAARVFSVSRKLKILLAEDNVVNRTFLSHFIHDAGHEVVTVVNGLEVLEKLEQERFDVVVMDVQMPEMDGVEATKRIRRSHASRLDPDVPIIALTAYAMKEDKERFLAAGMNACVTKPVNMDELFKMIRKAAGERASGEAQPAAPEESSPEAMESEEVLDVSSLNARFKGKEALLETLVGDFLVSVEEGMEKLCGAFADENLEEAASIAHSLVNAAIPIGSRLMVARGRDLEHAARNYGLKGAKTAYERLTPVVGEVLDRLKNLKAG